MPTPWRQSLVFQTSILMGGLMLLALISMTGSIVIAETASGDAAAINLAGTLRMQAYRLEAFRISNHPIEGPLDLRRQPHDDERDIKAESSAYYEQLINQLEHTLHDQVIISLIPDNEQTALNRDYQQVLYFWHQVLRPVLLGQRNESTTVIRELTRQFVEANDHLVDQLQFQSERRLLQLKLGQAVVLLLTLTIIGWSMYQLRVRWMPPLRELLYVMEKVRAGDFSGQVHYQSPDELGQLAQTINQMNTDLSHMYGQLEQRVAEKTAALSRTNDSLTLLYDASRLLNGHQSPATHFQWVLERLDTVCGLGPMMLCLKPQWGGQHVVSRPDMICSEVSCDACWSETTTPLYWHHQHLDQKTIGEAGEVYGRLSVSYPPTQMIQPWQSELIEAIAGLVATSLSLAEHHDNQRRVALMTERAVIARELHDSLAQSLSYLKIQVSRLQATYSYQRDADSLQAAQPIVLELREGLNSAYRQLRELLNTFRLTINTHGLADALDSTVAEFNRRGDVDIQLDHEPQHGPLTPNEEVHVLHIVREALSNVLHHACAQHCWVRVRLVDNGELEVSVRDDGVGIEMDSGQPYHYGLTIMHERATSLKGNITVSPCSPSGTEVLLYFQPGKSRPPTDAHALPSIDITEPR
ncbi:hypothetical protein BFW38_13200 [Terasakiispira papahanaumokuakeensis]|uniref:Sensor protein n=1 Tax=Terasakiispira papahanaumokuakeensis TaxID=197479 RepID=A0A1E2VC02_9GAMM|nr:histidine kinase [Terasakiispira papahanaumokuakeensis]ODC04346.1 hypothetical protein BFW38_13200 [Terasakiispira papahanaumokuakeensis]